MMYLAELIRQLSTMDIVTVLGALVACVIGMWGKLPKEWLYPEKELEKKISLAEEKNKEEQSRKLKLVLNNHYRKIGAEDNDFEDVLIDYSTIIQKHSIRRAIYQKYLFLTKLCFDCLLYSLVVGIMLFIASFCAISLKHKWFCSVIFAGVILLVLSQLSILLFLRKIKKEADNSINLNYYN